jgi:hypothetical protein
MPVTFKLTGLPQLMADLRELPESLRDEGRQIVQAEVNAAEAEVRAGYAEHRESGNLDRGLQQRHETASGAAVGPGEGRYGVRIVLRSGAKHAYLFEVGTQLPRKTDKGWNRGPMPAGKVFIPIVIRHRRRMYDRLAQLLVTAGLRVSGEWD